MPLFFLSRIGFVDIRRPIFSLWGHRSSAAGRCIETVIGLTVVAVGTSLPELAASVAAQSVVVLG